jgi:hypothetical protein
VGGMINSTLLDQIVTPALFYKFGCKVYKHRFEKEEATAESALADRFGLPSGPSEGNALPYESDGKERRATG